MLLDEVPEFNLPSILLCSQILSITEQRHIEEAARLASLGQRVRAEDARKIAGYGGCGSP